MIHETEPKGASIWSYIEQVTDPVIDMLEKVQTLSLSDDLEPLNNPFFGVTHYQAQINE